MSNTLIAKLAAASIKVGALATDKTNTQQNYRYISADKILERAGDALAHAGVMVVPSVTTENTEVAKTDKGGTRYDSLVHFAMIITDGETQIEMPWCGRGNDYSVPDKALYKAITSGHKYFLMKLLNIGVGNEDGEHENAQDAPQATQRTTAPRTTNTPQTAHRGPSTPDGVPARKGDDVAFGSMQEPVKSPPHQRMWGQGASTFGPDWDKGARPWLIGEWTAKVTPNNRRTSSSELSDDEKDQFADYIKANVTALQKVWAKQKKAQPEAVG